MKPRPHARPIAAAFVSALVTLIVSACADREASSGAASDGSDPSGGGATGGALEAIYEFGWVGGMTREQETARLIPPDTFRLTRTSFAGEPTVSCTATVPSSGTTDAIDLGEIAAALDGPSVPEAWTTPGEPVVFGRDMRPVDLPAWMIQRNPDSDAAAEILLGLRCDGETECRAIPPGLAELRTLLDALLAQQKAAPGCGGSGER